MKGIRNMVFLTMSVYLAVNLITSVCFAEEGFVGYWGFEEGKGDSVRDLSGSENHGTIKGKSQWTQGKDGMALSFSKPDAVYVDIKDSKSIDISEGITMSAWIKPSKIYLGDDWMERNCVVAKKRAYYLDITEQGNLASYLYNVQPQEWLVGKTDMTRFLGKWVHVATVYDGKEHKLYVNGKLDASVKKGGAIALNDENLTIGWVDNNRYFDGVIDEVKIWSKGLTEEEIAEILSVEAGNKLVTCWGILKRN